VSPAATIIVHLDGDRERARRCLFALAALDPEPAHEVIVVDDASTGLEQLLASLEGDVRIVRNERREGLGASAAAAAELAGAELIVLLAGAAELEPGALAPLLGALANPGVAGATASTPGDGSAQPVAARVLALRADSADVLGPAGVGPELEMAALCADLGRHGRVETVAASHAHPAPARAVSARTKPGQAVELTIVIPTLDAGSERLRLCLAAIATGTEAAHQIVIVDNGAPPQGFTAPVNAGLRAARTPYAVVMNDDVEPLPGWWAPLRRALDAGAEVVFPLTVEGGMRNDFAAWCFALDTATVVNFGHRPDEFFDPAMRVWYQDTDLLTRLRQAGRPPLLVRESRIRHGLSTTVASEDPELRAWIEQTVREDQAAFVRKHPGAVVVT
jgi:GT2 family glycosyltransferase